MRAARFWVLAVLVLAGVSVAAPGAEPASKGADAKWDVVARDGFAIAVPKGWRDLEELRVRATVLYLNGDGVGVPAMDETKSPLQVGMMVEKYPGTQETLKEGIEALVAGVKGAWEAEK